MILGLDDHLTADDLADYTDAEVEAASLDGVLYMPLIEAEVNGIAYNGGLLSELGYDPATASFGTWDELYALGERAAEQNWYLESLSTFSWGGFLVTVHEAGGQVYTDDRTDSQLPRTARHRCPDPLGQRVPGGLGPPGIRYRQRR